MAFLVSQTDRMAPVEQTQALDLSRFGGPDMDREAMAIVTVSSSELIKLITCAARRGVNLHTESTCGNVALAVALELGAGYISCFAIDGPQWASYLVICFPSLH